jgi:hypothetical protein
MKPRKTKDIDNRLKRKGFKEEKRDHTFYFLYYNNKKTSVYTKISHGISEYGNNLLTQMAQQLSLTNSELNKFLDCPLSYENLIQILKIKNRIKP